MNKGYKITKEHREKISPALFGRKFSAEHIRKMAKTKVGNKNMLGRHHNKYGQKDANQMDVINFIKT